MRTGFLLLNKMQGGRGFASLIKIKIYYHYGNYLQMVLITGKRGVERRILTIRLDIILINENQ